MARKIGRSGNVEAIRKCWVFGRLLRIDGKIGGMEEWRDRERCISMIFSLVNDRGC